MHLYLTTGILVVHYPAYQVARAIAEIHDIEDDGHPSIVHSKFISSLAALLFREYAC